MIPEWFSRLDPPLSTGPRLLEQLAWPEIAETLDGVLLLPVGATEQHGPHLPINTDTLIAGAACAYASALTGAPVLPSLSYGVSLGHTEKWPGTFSLYHETLISTVRQLGTWAVATGWKRLLLVNAHCGNDASLRCAIDRLRFDFPGQLSVASRNTWTLSDRIAQAFIADATDWHANQAETSLLLFLQPELVRLDRIEQSDDPDRTSECVFPHMVAQTSTNGVTGRPSTATAAQGAELMKQIGEALAALVISARTEVSPLSWNRNTRAFAT